MSINPVIPECDEWINLEKLKKEREVVGIYISAHPLDDFIRELNNFTSTGLTTLNDLNKKRFDRKTSQNQQRILSRMIDSQKSLTQRGYEEERKSKTAEQIQYTGPMGLPDDLGQRQSLIMNAMNSALKLGYSNDYQKMILNQLE